MKGNIMETMDNKQRYETYKMISGDLKKALHNGFYYEAIFIEYAILEDRFASVLKHAHQPYQYKKGKDYGIKDLIKNSRKWASQDKFYGERITEELKSICLEWVEHRNTLIHQLANIPYDSENVKSVALEGNEIVKVVKNKTASVINHIKKMEEQL